MTLRLDRGLPAAVVLALVGAVLGLGALLLPWFTLNEEAMKAFMRQIMSMIAEFSDEPMDPGQLDAFVSAGMPTLMEKASAELVGYKAFSPVSVGFHALAAGGGLFAALKAWSGSTSLQQQRSELALAGVVVAVRPMLALFRTPGLNDSTFGASGMSVPENLFGAGPGIWVALLGAALLGVAALMARDPEGAPAEAATWTAPAPAGAPVPAPYMPGGAPAAAAPTPYMPGGPVPAAATAYVPPAPAAYMPPAPAAAAPPTTPGIYTPGDAYGSEGPATLDRDSRLVRPHDPLAPRPLAAPAVPIMPAPAAVQPLHDPSPVTDLPGATYGLPPAPQPIPQAPPTRSGSTAPPGFS